MGISATADSSVYDGKLPTTFALFAFVLVTHVVIVTQVEPAVTENDVVRAIVACVRCRIAFVASHISPTLVATHLVATLALERLQGQATILLTPRTFR